MSSIIGPTGNIDPELLRVRLRAIPDGDWRARVSSVVECAIRCLSHFNGIDFLGLEREAPHKPARELWLSVESTLAGMWSGVEELQQAMQPLAELHEKAMPRDTLEQSASGLSSPGAVEEDSFDFALDTPAAAKRVPTQEERVWETGWAMSFVLAGELESFRKRLPTLLKVQDGWELVSAVQDHVGHMRSAALAVVTGVYSALPGEAPSQSDEAQNLELLASRELRARVFELRDEVLTLEAALRAAPQQQWPVLLMQVLRLVEAFVFGPAFAWMRAGDKRSFLAHQRQFDDIMALWSPLRAEPARRAVGAVARYLEALEVINQRECLVLHDREALKRVAANLKQAQEHPGSEARLCIGKAMAALADAQWRDKDLDALLAQTLDPAKPVPADAILDRVHDLLHKMGA